VLFSALKALNIEVCVLGVLLNHQQCAASNPPGWCDGIHIAPERPPHTSSATKKSHSARL